MPGHVFLSYSRHDRSYVEKLAAEITGAGLSVWFDHELAAGEQWSEVLERQIEECAVLVVVMSTASATSTWVKREVRLAQDLGKPVVPLLLSGRVWFVVNDLHHIDVTGGAVPDASFPRRLAALGAVARPRVAARPDPEHPPKSGGTPREASGSRPSATSGWEKAKAHRGAVSAVVWAPDSPRFLTTGADGTCQVWDAVSGLVTRVIKVPQSENDLRAVWRNENVIVTGGRDGLRWWDPEKGREVSRNLKHGRITALHAVTGYQADHELVVAGTATGRVVLMRSGEVELLRSASAARVVAVAAGRNRRLIGDLTPRVASVDVNRDGVSELTVWPVPSAGPGRPSTARLAPAIDPASEQIAWSEAGDLALARPVRPPGVEESAVVVFPGGTSSGEVVVPLGTTVPATSVAWGPGSRLAVGLADGTVLICDMPRRVVVRRLRTGAVGEVVIRWSPDGTLLVTAGAARGRVWPVEDGPGAVDIDTSGSAVAWAPRRNALVAGGVSGDVSLRRFEV